MSKRYRRRDPRRRFLEECKTLPESVKSDGNNVEWLETVPLDLLKHHIIPNLDLGSLISTRQTCLKLFNIITPSALFTQSVNSNKDIETLCISRSGTCRRLPYPKKVRFTYLTSESGQYTAKSMTKLERSCSSPETKICISGIVLDAVSGCSNRFFENIIDLLIECGFDPYNEIERIRIKSDSIFGIEIHMSEFKNLTIVEIPQTYGKYPYMIDQSFFPNTVKYIVTYPHNSTCGFIPTTERQKQLYRNTYVESVPEIKSAIYALIRQPSIVVSVVLYERLKLHYALRRFYGSQVDKRFLKSFYHEYIGDKRIISVGETTFSLLAKLDTDVPVIDFYRFIGHVGCVEYATIRDSIMEDIDVDAQTEYLNNHFEPHHREKIAKYFNGDNVYQENLLSRLVSSHYTVVWSLIEFGVDVHYTDENGEGLIFHMLRHFFSTQTTKHNWDICFTCRNIRNSIKLLQEKYGLDVNLPSKSGMTPVDLIKQGVLGLDEDEEDYWKDVLV